MGRVIQGMLKSFTIGRNKTILTRMLGLRLISIIAWSCLDLLRLFLVSYLVLDCSSLLRLAMGCSTFYKKSEGT